MENEIISRAKWLYASNAGAIPKEECVKEAIYESGLCDAQKLIEDLRIFDTSIGEYINDLCKKF